MANDEFMDGTTKAAATAAAFDASETIHGATAADAPRRPEFSDYFSTEEDLVEVVISGKRNGPDWTTEWRGMDPDTLALFRRINNGVGRKNGDGEAAFAAVLKRKLVRFVDCPFAIPNIEKYNGDVVQWCLKDANGKLFTSFVTPKYLDLVSPEMSEKN